MTPAQSPLSVVTYTDGTAMTWGLGELEQPLPDFLDMITETASRHP
jgi:hypothetical protein